MGEGCMGCHRLRSKTGCGRTTGLLLIRQTLSSRDNNTREERTAGICEPMRIDDSMRGVHVRQFIAVVVGVAVRVCAVAAGVGVVLVGASSPALAARGHVFGEAFGKAGSGAGELDFENPNSVPSAALAVNDTTHDLYVVENQAKRVQIFSEDGNYQGQLSGVAFTNSLSVAVDNYCYINH